MSVARGYGFNGKSLYANVAKPTECNLQFTVNHTDAAGLGITSLKSNGFVENVFMNTNQTPGSHGGFTNPNPLAGFAVIQMKQNFNVFLANRWNVISPNSGSAIKIDNSALTAGQIYTITTLGNATAAKWLAIGVPAGVTPAVGVSFVALTDGGTGNTITSRVQVPSVSGISGIEVIGVPNLMVNSNIASNSGQQIMIQFLGPTFAGSALAAHSHALALKNAAVSDGATTRVNAGTNLLGANTGSDITVAGGGANGGVQTASAGTPAGTVTYGPVAPADGSIVQLKLYFDGSSVTVDGL